MVTMTELDRQKRALLTRVKTWPETRLAFRPSPECWTVPEIFDHLAKTEAGIVAISQKGLANPHRIGLRDKAGVLFLDKIFRSDRQVKTPASAKAVLPAVEPALTDVLERWHQERAVTDAFVTGFPQDKLRAGIFRHPVAGWMNLPDVLNFFLVHMIHHEFQITRLEKTSAESAR